MFLKAAPKVANVLMISLLFLTIFAILGVQLFAGRFASCVDAPEVPTKAACVSGGGVWENPAFGHFDDVFHAMLMLFEMSGMEGWPDVMFQGVDAAAEDGAPVENFNLGAAFYFILWICVGGQHSI